MTTRLRLQLAAMILPGLYRALVLCFIASLLAAFVYSQTDFEHLSGRTFYKSLAISLAGADLGKAATPLVMLMLPLTLMVSIAAVAGVQRTPSWFTNLSVNSSFGCWSPWWMLYWGAQLVYLVMTYIRHSVKQQGYQLMGGTANSFAILGLLNLALFLLPVSKHTPILLALNVPAEVALTFHRIAGRTSIAAVLIHGILYMTKWVMTNESLLVKLLPPIDCFIGGAGEESGVQCETGHCDCHSLLANFTGVIAGCCFVGIFLSSLEWVRRRHYRVFYTCHVGFALVGCLFAVVHWSRLILYTLPAIVFYSLSVGFVFWELLLNRKAGSDGTSMLLSPVIGADSVYRLEITCRSAPHCPAPGQWVRLLDLNTEHYLPLGHPMSVCFSSFNSDSDESSFFTCFVRAQGLPLRKLCTDQNMRCLVEGYHGPADRMEQCKQRSNVILIAGGLGILAGGHCLV